MSTNFRSCLSLTKGEGIKLQAAFRVRNYTQSSFISCLSFTVCFSNTLRFVLANQTKHLQRTRSVKLVAPGTTKYRHTKVNQTHKFLLSSQFVRVILWFLKQTKKVARGSYKEKNGLSLIVHLNHYQVNHDQIDF